MCRFKGHIPYIFFYFRRFLRLTNRLYFVQNTIYSVNSFHRTQYIETFILNQGDYCGKLYIAKLSGYKC